MTPDSGGEVDIVVATSSEDIVDAVRLAFQDVFGKATVNGLVWSFVLIVLFFYPNYLTSLLN